MCHVHRMSHCINRNLAKTYPQNNLNPEIVTILALVFELGKIYNNARNILYMAV